MVVECANSSLVHGRLGNLNQNAFIPLVFDIHFDF